MKTAEQWQKDLNLEGLPDAELLELLNKAEGMETAPFTAAEALASGLVTELNPDNLEQEIEELYTAETVGAALSAARGARHVSTRELARRLHLSGARITKIEKGVNVEIATVRRYLGALDYQVCLTMKPREGGGPVITVPFHLLGEAERLPHK